MFVRLGCLTSLGRFSRHGCLVAGHVLADLGHDQQAEAKHHWHANEQWVADYMTPEQAAASVLDTFKMAVRQELEFLDPDCVDGAAPDAKAPDTRLEIFEGLQGLPGSEVKFREDLDQIAGLNAGKILHIYRRCHDQAGLRAEYRDGKLLLSCAECWQPLAFVELLKIGAILRVSIRRV